VGFGRGKIVVGRKALRLDAVGRRALLDLWTLPNATIVFPFLPKRCMVAVFWNIR
jgi:hypothetical protein